MNKAYIVTNKKQELEVLKKLEQEGLVWVDKEKPTEWLPSEKEFGLYNFDFPCVISFSYNGSIIWFPIEELEDEEIVYDGRKRRRVTQEFMNELIEWRDENNIKLDEEDVLSYVVGEDIMVLPNKVDEWWEELDNPRERNNRLITIIQWLNGEDVFEV